MPKKTQPITGAELALLEALWETGPATKRQLMVRLYPKASDSDRSTVQKLLERLEAKDYVDRDRKSPAHIFAAKITRTEFAGRELERLAERFANGSCLPLVAHFVENHRLTAKERAELRKLLDR
jgi:predicted transcriptional regulator